MKMMEKRVKLKSVNTHITCTLCRGYLIEATTITECLHTCKYILLCFCFFGIVEFDLVLIIFAAGNKAIIN